MTPAKPTADAQKAAEQKTALALSVLRRKKAKTPLEDLLQTKGANRSVTLCQWARTQFNDYNSGLMKWRDNRRRYAEESQDVFASRARDHEKARDDMAGKPIFPIRNDSLNVVAGMAEFAAAQAEQDLVGGEPWFAAAPVGNDDVDLADTIQKHLQWTFRDGSIVDVYGRAITTAACLGEAFMLTRYEIETDSYEVPMTVLYVNGKPATDANGDYFTPDKVPQDATEQQAFIKEQKLSGKVTWGEAYAKKSIVIKQGIEKTLLSYKDIAFRQDAPSLDLKHTNFYHVIELTVFEAQQRFNLSRKDAIRLAMAASITDSKGSLGIDSDALVDTNADGTADNPYGDEEGERMMNSRIHLVQGYVRVDPVGDGLARRICIVFPPSSEDWIVWCDYLGNISPRSELPVSVVIWEAVSDRLYGRGFFGKYSSVQTYIDNTWNQVGFRNEMHANPVAGTHTSALDTEDDEPDIELKPGLSIPLAENKKLADFIEILALPDLDERSMEMLQIAVQMAQMRSGITSASQGDLSGTPESNTATGIRQLMSRAAVLLKKPINGMRRAFGRDFSFTVRLFYANFDRNEAFVWGEGRNQQMLEMTADKVRDLDIDIRLLLTQQQNQTKLEGAQVATAMFERYAALAPAVQQHGRPLYLQALKALEFDQSDSIIWNPAVTIEGAIAMLPPEEQQRFQMLVQAASTAQAAQQPNNVEAMPSQTPTQPQTQAA